MKKNELTCYTEDFEVWRAHIKQTIRITGEMGFINTVDKNDYICELVKKDNMPCAHYLLAMYDHICHKHKIPFDEKYKELREIELPTCLFPANAKKIRDRLGISSIDIVTMHMEYAISDFIKYNIVEVELYMRDFYEFPEPLQKSINNYYLAKHQGFQAKTELWYNHIVGLIEEYVEKEQMTALEGQYIIENYLQPSSKVK